MIGDAETVIKMYAIFCRETLKDFQANEGKLAAQAGHAYLHAWLDAEKRLELENKTGSFWGRCDCTDYALNVMYRYKDNNDARKIALVVNTVAELHDLANLHADRCGVSLVEDCGYTIFDKPTITCLGLGPIDDDDKLDILRSLELLRHEL